MNNYDESKKLVDIIRNYRRLKENQNKVEIVDGFEFEVEVINAPNLDPKYETAFQQYITDFSKIINNNNFKLTDDVILDFKNNTIVITYKFSNGDADYEISVDVKTQKQKITLITGVGDGIPETFNVVYRCNEQIIDFWFEKLKMFKFNNNEDNNYRRTI